MVEILICAVVFLSVYHSDRIFRDDLIRFSEEEERSDSVSRDRSLPFLDFKTRVIIAAAVSISAAVILLSEDESTQIVFLAVGISSLTVHLVLMIKAARRESHRHR